MVKRLLSFIMLILLTFTFVSCGQNEMTEDTPLILSSQELDGVFNPFFSSSAPDSQIVGYMTAPWCSTTKENNEMFKKSFDSIKEARAHFYK